MKLFGACFRGTGFFYETRASIQMMKMKTKKQKNKKKKKQKKKKKKIKENIFAPNKV